jgi:hypothetical protein
MLPPSRRRGILYANNLSTRRRTSSSITRRNNIFSPIVGNSIPRRNNIFSPIVGNHIQRHDNYIFWSQLQDVKIGLLTKNLIKNSSVKLNDVPSFCVVCQDDIVINDIVRNIKCSHSFHINCIDNWFIENKKCPICKYEL